MDSDDLDWLVTKKEILLQTPVFDVERRQSVSQTGVRGNYYAIQSPDWVLVVPVFEDSFLLVRQYRHGCARITREFPGGAVEPGESPEAAAERELLEETGFTAGKITVLGSCSPNPALFTNRFTVCLAEELKDTGRRAPDEDEVIGLRTVPIAEVLDDFCSGELVHAFMGTALALYLRHTGCLNVRKGGRILDYSDVETR